MLVERRLFNLVDGVMQSHDDSNPVTYPLKICGFVVVEAVFPPHHADNHLMDPEIVLGGDGEC